MWNEWLILPNLTFNQPHGKFWSLGLLRGIIVYHVEKRKTHESRSPHGIPQKHHIHVNYKYTRHRSFLKRRLGRCLQSFQRVRTYKSHTFLDGRHCYQSQFLDSTKGETLQNCTRLHSKCTNNTVYIPGGTFSGAPGWKNFVWWFFWATITTNFGFHLSSRNLHDCILKNL